MSYNSGLNFKILKTQVLKFKWSKAMFDSFSLKLISKEDKYDKNSWVFIGSKLEKKIIIIRR